MKSPNGIIEYPEMFGQSFITSDKPIDLATVQFNRWRRIFVQSW